MRMTGDKPDRRLNAYRDDLADEALKGKVEAASFTAGAPYHVAAASTPVFPAPRSGGDRDTEALSGEAVTVFERREGWAWAQLECDRYVGYIADADLVPSHPPTATHVVTAPRALVYAAPTARSPAIATRFFAARVRAHQSVAAGDAFLELETGGFIGRPHVAVCGIFETDIVASAQKFRAAPYLWGGKSVQGIDCSGLVQLALDRAGIDCPRDTDLQQARLPGDIEIGTEQLPPLRRGDLIYWPGHVGIMVDASRVIHANAHSMSVTIDPVLEVAARARGAGPVAAAVKRLAPPLA